MTSLTLAVKNVRHQLRSYAAFFLSSTVSVWMFFLYASLLTNPRFTSAELPPMVLEQVGIVNVLVGFFSVMFILYAFTAFLRARQRELALLTLLGMRPGEVSRLIYMEITMIGAGAIGLGVALGVVCMKLFYMGIGRVLALRNPIPAHFSLASVGLTVLVFGGVFLVIAFLGHLRIRRLSPAALIRGAAAPLEPPRFSWWLVALGIGSLGTSYYLTLTAVSAGAVADRIYWILGSALVGTYLFFTQISLFVLRWLQQRRSFYYRPTGLLAVSQLTYKVTENARVLFTVSILSSMVLLFVGAFYSSFATLEQQSLREQPYHLMIASTGERAVETALVERLLAQSGIEAAENVTLPGLRAELEYQFGPDRAVRTPGAAVVALSDFNRWRERLMGQPPLSVPEGEAAVVVPDRIFRGEIGSTVRLAFSDAGVPGPPGRADVELPLHQRLDGLPFNQTTLTRFAIVVTDKTFAQLAERYGEKFGFRLMGYRLANWKESGPFFTELATALGYDDGGAFRTHLRGAVSGTYLYWFEGRQAIGFQLFLMAFLSLLFFLASGNMLYFKLFTDLGRDRLQFQSLHKVGLSAGEMGRVVSSQISVLFFLPVLVAAVHVSVLMKMFADEMEISLRQPMAAVIAGYLLLQGTYYLIARRTYVRALLESH